MIPEIGCWFVVVPAAGRSVRMGQPKLLLPWNDADGRRQTLLERVLAVWRSLEPTEVTVTVHPDDVDLFRLCDEAGVTAVVPSVPPPDMKASILLGLNRLDADRQPDPDDPWLTAPADLPNLSRDVIATLLQAYDRSAPQILRPVHAGRFGHPTLLPWSTTSLLAQIPSDRGLDYLFERLPFTAVEAGEACLAADIDTPADYRRLHDR